MLTAKNIAKSYDKEKVLKDVSVQVNDGEVVAIIGRSGSGKSTLLRCLNHLELIDNGEIEINNMKMVTTTPSGDVCYAQKDELREICLKMGFVFQNYNLFPHMTVLKNLCQAQERVLKRPKIQSQARSLELLKKVGLQGKENQYPCQLSGGQQQRVAIARALALDPQFLCFDEPTSALDPQLTQEVLNVIRDLAKEKRTMLVVTHEMRFAKEVADRIIFMQDGIVKAQGKPDELMGDNCCTELKTFLGMME